MNIQKWIKENTSSLKGKTIAITGSTGGLGFELCHHLANLGANFIFINRNPIKSNKLKDELEELYPNIKIEIVIADLSSFNNTKQAVQILKNKQINFLILNAGIYAVPKSQTEIGYNNIFTTNFVSHYYMVKELLPNLRKNNGHVVCVGSIAHNYGKLDVNDIDYTTRKKHSKVYGNSKRFLMFSLMELFKAETDTTLSVTHPGVTFTNITNHYPKIIYALIKYPMKILFPSPKKASLHIVSGLFNYTKPNTWIGPKILSVWGKPKINKLNTCNNNESKKIFKIAENIYNNLKNSEI